MQAPSRKMNVASNQNGNSIAGIICAARKWASGEVRRDGADAESDIACGRGHRFMWRPGELPCRASPTITPDLQGWRRWRSAGGVNAAAENVGYDAPEVANRQFDPVGRFYRQLLRVGAAEKLYDGPAEVGKIIGPTTGDKMAVHHDGCIDEYRPRVDQIIPDAGRTGHFYATIHSG